MKKLLASFVFLIASTLSGQTTYNNLAVKTNLNVSGVEPVVSQTRYQVYNPSITRNYILNQATSGYKYNHDSSLAYYGGVWYAQWNANTNQYESQVGQINLQSTSTDFVNWSSPVPVFIDSSTSSNPVTYSYATDLQWQPNLAVVGPELWSLWSQQVPGTYPSGLRVYFSKLTSTTSKWTNVLLSLNYTERGMTFYGFPTQNPIQLQSGRVLAPLVWIATNQVSPIPSGWTSADTFFVAEKRAGVLYTDDGGVNWNIGGVTTLPGANYVAWEPVIQQSNDGSIRMYCRNLDYRNYGYSQFMLTAVGSSDGLVFGPLGIVSVDTTSSRYGYVQQQGKNPRQITLLNDWISGGFVSDRYNGAVSSSRSSGSDLVFGNGWSGTEPVVSYPQGVVNGSSLYIIYSQGSVPRSIKTAKLDPVPSASTYYLYPRANDSINPFVAYVAGPPAYFDQTSSSVMYSVSSSTTWANTNITSVGAWLYKTTNPGSEAWIDNRELSAAKGFVFGAVSGSPFMNMVPVGYPSGTNIIFSTLTTPLNEWFYAGLTIDASTGTATCYVVNAAGVATSETATIPPVYGVNGTVAYIGRAQPGSGLSAYTGRVRHILVINGIAASTDNHRYWHGLDQVALGVADWVGPEVNPGVSFWNYDAGSPDAGSNNAAWLASWAPTGNSVRGSSFSTTVGGVSALAVTGTGSAGVELPRFERGQQLTFGTLVYPTNKTATYDQVFLTIGNQAQQIQILSRSTSPTLVEVWNQLTGRYITIGTYVTNQWIPLSVIFDGPGVTISWNNGPQYRLIMASDTPRLYMGQGYLNSRTLNPLDGVAFSVPGTWFHVGQKTTAPAEQSPDYAGVTILNATPGVTLIPTSSGVTNYIYNTGNNIRMDQNRNSQTPFRFDLSTGNLTIGGVINVSNNIQSVGQQINRTYGLSAIYDARRLNGSTTSPTTILSGDQIALFGASGYDGTSEVSARVAFGSIATQTWTPTAQGSKAIVQTTPNGTTTRGTVWEWDNDANTTMIGSAPVMNFTASNGSSGLRMSVVGGNGNNVFRVQTNSVTIAGIGIVGNGYFGTSSPDASAELDVVSTTRGLLPPRMTQVQRNAIPTPATGLEVFCTDCIATDGSTGVTQTFSSGSWRNHY